MSYITTVTEKTTQLISKSSVLLDRNRLLLAAVPAALIACFLPAAARDYQAYLDLGPGGPPYNVAGWLVVKFLSPLRGEMFGTRIYDRKVQAGEQVEYLGELPLRQGDRPKMGSFAVPQRQINQWPSQQIKEKLMAEYGAFFERNAHVINRVPSILERFTDAAHVCHDVPLTPVAKEMKREICHVHGTSDHSVHVTLAPSDCKRVIDSGWGQRFTLGGSGGLKTMSFGRLPALSTEYVFIYAPRDEKEIKIVLQIIKASVQYVTGLSDVK
ncbi:hypothetical protein BDW62DRAFT_183992 [Aspergillus aurantiobrunneus]